MLEVMSCKKLTKETKQDVVEIQGDLPEGVVKRLERGNKRIDIVYEDTDAESPREWCNLGIMACSHSRYNIGEEKPNPNGPEDAVLVRTLWFHEHGMGKLYTGKWPPDEYDRYDRFDTSCIGYMYTTMEKIKSMYYGGRICRQTRTLQNALIPNVRSTHSTTTAKCTGSTCTTCANARKENATRNLSIPVMGSTASMMPLKTLDSYHRHNSRTNTPQTPRIIRGFSFF